MFYTFSSLNSRNSRQTFLEDNVNDGLNLLGIGCRCLGEDGDDAETEGLGISLGSTRGDGPVAETSSIVLVKTNHTTDGLTDGDVVHGAHEDNSIQTGAVDALAEDAVVQNNELLVVVLAPGVESLEELLTTTLDTVDDGTSLGTDIHVGITTVSKLLSNISLVEQVDDLLDCLGTHQDLVNTVIIDGIDDVFAVRISSHTLSINQLTLHQGNARGNDETCLDESRSRDIDENIAVDTEVSFIPALRTVAECLGVAVKKKQR